MNFIKETHLSPVKNFLLDLIFPRYCLGCKKEIESKQPSQICDGCFGKIVLNSGIQCHVCGLRIGNGAGLPAGDVPKGHKNCRKKTSLSGLFSSGQYKDPILRELIQSFKYRSVESLKIPLAKLMINYLTKEFLTDKLTNSVLAPIPLTLKRNLSRGFNQSELLAKEIGGHFNCPVINLLKRTKFNIPQVEIPDWQSRKENVSGAFCLSKSDFGEFLKSDSAKIKKVILVDDVSTSGATLEEAARVLKEAGVKEIYGLVIAKG